MVAPAPPIEELLPTLLEFLRRRGDRRATTSASTAGSSTPRSSPRLSAASPTAASTRSALARRLVRDDVTEPAAAHARHALPHPTPSRRTAPTPTPPRPPRCSTRCSNTRRRSACSASTTSSRSRRSASHPSTAKLAAHGTHAAWCPASTCSGTGGASALVGQGDEPAGAGARATSPATDRRRCRSCCARRCASSTGRAVGRSRRRSGRAGLIRRLRPRLRPIVAGRPPAVYLRLARGRRTHLSAHARARRQRPYVLGPFRERGDSRASVRRSPRARPGRHPARSMRSPAAADVGAATRGRQERSRELGLLADAARTRRTVLASRRRARVLVFDRTRRPRRDSPRPNRVRTATTQPVPDVEAAVAESLLLGSLARARDARRVELVYADGVWASELPRRLRLAEARHGRPASRAAAAGAMRWRTRQRETEQDREVHDRRGDERDERAAGGPPARSGPTRSRGTRPRAASGDRKPSRSGHAEHDDEAERHRDEPHEQSGSRTARRPTCARTLRRDEPRPPFDDVSDPAGRRASRSCVQPPRRRLPERCRDRGRGTVPLPPARRGTARAP